MSVQIRDSRPEDLPAIHAIYAYHVLHGTGSFETEPPSIEEIARRREAVLGDGLPHLVAEKAGLVTGFAYAGKYRPRPAYRFTVEDSIYVSHGSGGLGIGRALLEALIARCEAAGLRQMMAVIGDSANAGSIGVHRAAGFTEAGIARNIGFKFGRWLDVVTMQRALGDGDKTFPSTFPSEKTPA